MNHKLRVAISALILVIVTLAGAQVALANNTEQPSPAVSQASGTVYVVRRGDSLGAIAARFGVSVSAIVRANGIRNPNLIFAGQRLVIPGRGSSSAAGAASAPATGGVYVVRRGDSLGAIAVRYGTSVAALARANRIANPSIIYVGQRLVIPRRHTRLIRPLDRRQRANAARHSLRRESRRIQCASQYRYCPLSYRLGPLPRVCEAALDTHDRTWL
jgi:LysM repeat protein